VKVSLGGEAMAKYLFQAVDFRRNSHWNLGGFRFSFSTQGNLQIMDLGSTNVVWASGTIGDRMAIQDDGNLAIYDMRGKSIWATDTAGNRNAILAMQDDGRLVVYTPDLQQALWHAGAPPRK
jgi:hypothetical protein